MPESVSQQPTAQYLRDFLAGIEFRFRFFTSPCLKTAKPQDARTPIGGCGVRGQFSGVTVLACLCRDVVFQWRLAL
jgi:hypothetical protein